MIVRAGWQRRRRLVVRGHGHFEDVTFEASDMVFVRGHNRKRIRAQKYRSSASRGKFCHARLDHGLKELEFWPGVEVGQEESVDVVANL
ncbi:hypothetical protein FJTKL_10825 [Diaporthe vaccinii]|uniref:Uncharacterized protein n=1 Tax=Diaporthe vaccinii TaxID=105482 RepID=A0ABR4FBW4_9PEZI